LPETGEAKEDALELRLIISMKIKKVKLLFIKSNFT